MKAKMDASQEQMEANQETMGTAHRELRGHINASEQEMKTSLEKMGASQEKNETKIKCCPRKNGGCNKNCPRRDMGCHEVQLAGDKPELIHPG